MVMMLYTPGAGWGHEGEAGEEQAERQGVQCQEAQPSINHSILSAPMVMMLYTPGAGWGPEGEAGEEQAEFQGVQGQEAQPSINHSILSVPRSMILYPWCRVGTRR